MHCQWRCYFDKQVFQRPSFLQRRSHLDIKNCKIVWHHILTAKRKAFGSNIEYDPVISGNQTNFKKCTGLGAPPSHRYQQKWRSDPNDDQFITTNIRRMEKVLFSVCLSVYTHWVPPSSPNWVTPIQSYGGTPIQSQREGTPSRLNGGCHHSVLVGGGYPTRLGWSTPHD